MELHVIEWLSMATLSAGLLYAIFIAYSNLNWLPYQPENPFGAHNDWKNVTLSENTRLLLHIALVVITRHLALFYITELAYFVINDSKHSLYP
ncbi:hypothetical protein [Psychromonas hadalis]|uniref:hypothetical protein n=1 Tax=Psychromonas hadalis TaxID=211669 RepID=UPI0003B79D67|nr:hypothetical protein [Psychromonas hadalis]